MQVAVSGNSASTAFAELFFGCVISEHQESPLGKVHSNDQMCSHWISHSFGLVPTVDALVAGATDTTLSIGAMACAPSTNVVTVVMVLMTGSSFFSFMVLP